MVTLKSDSRYRLGACIVLVRETLDRVLVCHRIDRPGLEGWQFPQGGLKKEGQLVSEAKRELHEEIGTDHIEVLKVSERTYCYTLPEAMTKKKRLIYGQCHWWILAKLLVSDDCISFAHEPAEFDAYEWVSPETILSRVVDFKKDAYRKALADLGLIEKK